MNKNEMISILESASERVKENKEYYDKIEANWQKTIDIKKEQEIEFKKELKEKNKPFDILDWI